MHMPLVLTNRRRRGGSASAPAFSPTSLYSSGSQGIWLDPSDVATMFSDRAGTTPVTAPGTVVGLRLDKSKGLVLGAELVTNGDFSGGTTTGWTGGNGASLSVASGALRTTATTANFAATNQQVATVAGRWYEVRFTIVAFSNVDTFRFRMNVSPSDVGNNAANLLEGSSGSVPLGEKVARFLATANNLWFTAFTRNAVGSSLDIDNISVRELPGNHAVAPTDAARPIYGVEPKGGRRNLLTYSEAFDNAVWSDGGQFSSPISANVSNSPADTMTADRVTLSSAATGRGRRQDVSGFSSASSAVSVWVKAADTGSATHIRLTTNNTVAWNTGQSVKVALTTSWQRISLSGALIASGSSVRVIVGVVDVAGSVDTDCYGDVLIWGAQLELGSTATAYQRVTTAYDITESGVATCHYVQYDGSDDSLSTSAIDFTATDKMSVFAGVRKLSDAGTSMFAELSANAGSNNGAFYIAVPEPPTYSYSVLTKGTTNNGFAGAALASFPAPINSILTTLGDISGDTAKLRINGTQVAQSTADQGTGNFGNYPLFIGRRNNATLPFNGRDFGILVVGKAVTPTEITDTETWLAAKTSGVTI